MNAFQKMTAGVTEFGRSKLRPWLRNTLLPVRSRLSRLAQFGASNWRALTAIALTLLFAALGANLARLRSGLGWGEHADTWMHWVVQPLEVITLVTLGLRSLSWRSIITALVLSFTIATTVVTTGKYVAIPLQHLGFWVYPHGLTDLGASRQVHAGVCFMHYALIGAGVWFRPPAYRRGGRGGPGGGGRVRGWFRRRAMGAYRLASLLLGLGLAWGESSANAAGEMRMATCRPAV